MKIKVLFDGMDLSGKSTVAKAFAMQRPEFTLRRTFLCPDNPHVKTAFSRVEDSSSPLDISKLFIEAVTHDIESHPMLDEKIILDGPIMTRIPAHLMGRGEGAEERKVAEYYLNMLDSFPDPEEAFYLWANMKERVSRLKKRMDENPNAVTQADLLLFEDPVLFQSIEEMHRHIVNERFNPTVVDTSGVTEQEVLDFVNEKRC